MDLHKLTQLDTNRMGKLGNTKTNLRSRKFCITLNNFSKVEYSSLLKHFKLESLKYIVGKEGDTKTPHLQIYVIYKNARSFKSIKDICPRGHIEKAKGSLIQNFEYCSKEGNYVANFDIRTTKEKAIDLCLQEYKDVVWKPFQTRVLDLIEARLKSKKRFIYWFYERTGNVGKSFLCKYIVMKYKVIIGEGKKNDVFNQINTFMLTDIPEIVLLDIPRDNLDFINYGAIESIMNGCIYSGKYEGGVCIFPKPLVIVFANDKPDKTRMSLDRWKISKIRNVVG